MSRRRPGKRLQYGLTALTYRWISKIFHNSLEDWRVRQWRSDSRPEMGWAGYSPHGYWLDETTMVRAGSNEARLLESIKRLENRNDLPLDPDGYDPFGRHRGTK